MPKHPNTRTPVATMLAIAALPSITAILAPFAALYFINVANLAFPWQAHLRPLLAAAAAVFAAGLVLQLAAPRRLRPAASGLVLALGALAWAEATLLVADVGALQGHAVRWPDHAWLLGGELVLVVVMARLWRRHRDAVLRRAPGIVGLLVVSSLASLYPAYVDHQSQIRTPPKGAFSRQGVFALSPERNVVVFILDTFQADVFAEIVADDPAWRGRLEGFTWFPDAASGFPKTYASVPEALTGRTFANGVPYSRYQARAYLDGSLPAELRRRGFDARVHAIYPQPYLPHPDVLDNVVRERTGPENQALRRSDFAALANLVLLRVAPFALKPWVFHDGQFRLGSGGGLSADPRLPCALKTADRRFSGARRLWDLEFLDRVLTCLDASSEKPALRIYHLQGIHEPLLMLPDLVPAAERRPDERASFRDQAAALLVLLEHVLERMKELGVYDNSTIVVMGDHGAGEFAAAGYRPELLAAAVGERAPAAPIDAAQQRLMRGASPLVLVKPAGGGGGLAVSPAPVALADLPATVLADLGLPAPAGQVSMLARDPAAPRTRLHKDYVFTDWDVDFIDPLVEYRIDGRTWDAAAWRPSGRDLAAGAAGR
jgi:hypothetical protein